MEDYIGFKFSLRVNVSGLITCKPRLFTYPRQGDKLRIVFIEFPNWDKTSYCENLLLRLMADKCP